MIHTILWLVRARYKQIKSRRQVEEKMPELELESTITESAATSRFFVRFTREQRIHAPVLFSTFLGLAATGLPMRFSESYWARKFAAGVGGFGAILFFHKFWRTRADGCVPDSCEGGFPARSSAARKGNLLGCHFDVANWKDVTRILSHALVHWAGPQAAIRALRLGKFDYWLFLGMDRHRLLGLRDCGSHRLRRTFCPMALNAVLVIHSEEGLLAILFHCFPSTRQHTPPPRQFSPWIW